MIVKFYRNSAFWTIVTRAVLFSCFATAMLPPAPIFSTPHFSSKAIRIATQAKKLLSSTTVGKVDLEHAAASIHALLSDPSLRRLDLQDQVEVLLLLTRIYERLGEWGKQEQLLTSYSKKREFHNYYVSLKLALARSYILQNRFLEAESILSNIIGRSCARMPQDEKRQIAAVLLLKDSSLSRLLHHADRLRKEHSYRASIAPYTAVLDSIERGNYPSQSSRVEREKLAVRIRLTLSECLVVSGHYKEAHALLHAEEKWPYDIFEEPVRQCIEESRTKLCSLLLVGEQGPTAENSSIVLASSPQESLWWLVSLFPSLDVQVDAENFSPDETQTLHQTHHILDLLSRAQFYTAQKEMLSLISSITAKRSQATQFQLEVKTLLFGILIDLLWDETSLYIQLNKPEAACRVMDYMRKLWEAEPYEKANERRTFWDTTVLPVLCEKEMALSLLSSFEQQSTATLPLMPSLCKSALQSVHHASSFFQYASRFPSQTLHQDECDQLMASLISTWPALHDPQGHALFFHITTDLLLRQGRHADAFSTFLELRSQYPEYDGFPKLAFHLLLASRAQAALYKEERAQVCDYLLQAEDFSPELYMSILYDQTALLHVLTRDVSPELTPFSQGVFWWKCARKSIQAAEMARDPGQMKDAYELAFSLYQHASDLVGAAFSSEKAPFSRKNREILALSRTTIDHEWLSSVLATFHRSEAVYNELVASLEKAACSVRDHNDPSSGMPPSQDLQCLQQITPIYHALFSNRMGEASDMMRALITNNSPIRPEVVRATILLCRLLREQGNIEEEEPFLLHVEESELKQQDHALALSVAFEKALFFRQLQDYDRAMNMLSWIINDSYPSSLRIRSMLIRADIYIDIQRKDLAVRQLEAVAAKGGEWAKVAERKLEELACI